MAERKTLTITQVNEVQKVGDKQIPKLSFKAKDGDKELLYFTFKSSLFESIKEGQTISADIETEERGEYTNRKVVQIYVDGQPIMSKGGGRTYGKSPEELEQTARLMILAYAKDLAVAQVIPLGDITKQADAFYAWMKGNGDKPASPAKQAKAPTEEQEFENLGKLETQQEPEPLPKKLGYIDGQWFRENLAEIQKGKGDSWANAHLLNYITKSYKVKGETVEKAVANLSQEAASHFVKKMEGALASISVDALVEEVENGY